MLPGFLKILVRSSETVRTEPSLVPRLRQPIIGSICSTQHPSSDVSRSLKNVKRIAVQHNPDAPRQTETDRGAPGQTTVHQDTPRHIRSDDEEFANLKTQVRSLEMDKIVRDRSIQFLEGQLGKSEERTEKYVERLIEQSRVIGDMERQLNLLSAPTQQAPVQDRSGNAVHRDASDYSVEQPQSPITEKHEFLARQQHDGSTNNPQV